MFACSDRWQEVPEANNVFGTITREPAGWFGSVVDRETYAQRGGEAYENALQVVRQPYQSNAGNFANTAFPWFDGVYRLFNYALRNGATTGTAGGRQNFGSDSLWEVSWLGWPRALRAYQAAQMQWGWDTYSVETDGRPVTAESHPRCPLWYGRPWAGNASYQQPPAQWAEDALGKDSHPFRGKWWGEDGQCRPEIDNWIGPNEEHDNDRYLYAYSLYSGDPWHRDLIEHNAHRWCMAYKSPYTINGRDLRAYENNGRVYNGITYGASQGRALGRPMLTGAHMYQLTELEVLKDYLLGKGRLAKYWFNQQGSPRDVWGVRVFPPDSRNLDNYHSWVAWEDCWAIHGLYAYYQTVDQDPDLLDMLKKMARSIAIEAWYTYDGGVTYQPIANLRAYPITGGYTWQKLTPAQYLDNVGTSGQVKIVQGYFWWMLPPVLLGVEWAPTYLNGQPDQEWLDKAMAVKDYAMLQRFGSSRPSDLQQPGAALTLPFMSLVSDPFA